MGPFSLKCALATRLWDGVILTPPSMVSPRCRKEPNYHRVKGEETGELDFVKGA